MSEAYGTIQQSIGYQHYQQQSSTYPAKEHASQISHSPKAPVLIPAQVRLTNISTNIRPTSTSGHVSASAQLYRPLSTTTPTIRGPSRCLPECPPSPKLSPLTN